MPDEDRITAAITDLTNQVARVAWANEARVLQEMAPNTFEALPCAKCGSMLVPVDEAACPACLEPKKEKPDV